MTKDKIQEVFLITVCEQFSKDLNEVSLGDRFREELKADSLDSIELIMACEYSFGLSIPDEDVENIKTIKEAIDYLDKRINQEQSK